ncbi:poly(glycerol-phosphate) alpha-glucosyltransferase [Arthrobacter pascens]|uniref:glycosyltransferase n=1 Tax=Arthrobacter pascens TaxID=1677 RepID=UPI00278242FE|nr:glycosyltransferase [Arthrobacter pascens]MDQ0633526.1 poly(glycerol-phosphate) alpha-glucosyltransferase [Arthrobacter pascens]
MNKQDAREDKAPGIPPLPAGYHCAITWGIPMEYGGMTNALLHRSRAFIQEAGVPVDVLTFEWSVDYSEIRCELEIAGELIPGLRLRNLWEELGELSESQLASSKPGKNVTGEFSPIGPGEESADEIFAGLLRRRIRYAADQKTELQIDYFRPDGSLMVTDRRDVQAKGTAGGRLITLCGLDGRPVASWNQVWPLYLFWLDCVVAGRESFMIVDSKSTANFMTRYRRNNVVTLHLVHNSHMASGALPPHGELSPTRRYVFERLNSFDAVVFLTESQKKDVDLVFDNPPNTCVIPNSRSFPALSEPENGHIAELGIVLGALTGRKRLDHAIRAVAKAGESSDLDYRLEIYGQGPDHAALLRLIQSSGLEGHVALRGYSIDARQEFERASFTLLTSKLEGQGLVLIEAMSVGCIPISYDVPYGPADIIQDGVNGFLVPAGDIPAMAEKIRLIGDMDAEDLKNMRRAAVSRAHSFNDELVVQTWGTAMRAAVDRKLGGATWATDPRWITGPFQDAQPVT